MGATMQFWVDAKCLWSISNIHVGRLNEKVIFNLELWILFSLLFSSLKETLVSCCCFDFSKTFILHSVQHNITINFQRGFALENNDIHIFRQCKYRRAFYIYRYISNIDFPRDSKFTIVESEPSYRSGSPIIYECDKILCYHSSWWFELILKRFCLPNHRRLSIMIILIDYLLFYIQFDS